jgi:hypothetical protein
MQAARAANSSTVRLSSGICANILDFRIPQKHVLTGVSPQGRQVGGPGVTTSATAQGAISADPGESLWEFHSIKSMA